MPMSIRRAIALGASFVCSVESTRWPVSAASTAIWAVSRVADLADHDDVRIGAHHRAQAGGERQAGLRVDLHLLDARRARYSTGSSIVMMFFSGVLSCCSARVERRRLAGAGRAGDEHGAVGAREAPRRSGRARASSMPRSSSVDDRAVPCRGRACTTRLAVDERQRRRRGRRCGGRRRSAPMRPSCGRRRSAMSSSAMILMREMTPATMRARDVRRVAQHAVDAEADREARRPSGSKWMSDAPCSTAWAMSEFTSLTTGASSADSRSSTTSAVVADGLLDDDASIDWSMRPRRADSGEDVLARRDGRPDRRGRSSARCRRSRARCPGRPSRRAACASSRKPTGTAPSSAWRPRRAAGWPRTCRPRKALRSTWSTPKRSAMTRASWSGVRTPRSTRTSPVRRPAARASVIASSTDSRPA